MELAPDVPGMRLQLDHLYQRSVGRQAAEIQSMLDELIAVFVVDLVPMAMALADLWNAVDRGGLGSHSQSARVCPEPHRAAHVGHVLLVLHQRNDRVIAFGCKLAGMAVGQADDVASELDDRGLHSEADPEKRES